MSLSPPFASSSCTLDAKRFSPARCATLTSSTTAAGPQGVDVFVLVMSATLPGIDAPV